MTRIRIHSHLTWRRPIHAHRTTQAPIVLAFTRPPVSWAGIATGLLGAAVLIELAYAIGVLAS